ncbi:unnamed protein product [Moneuplotes crassus]|uniref:Uncharacterized protein n=1 Tax=Euplotes crassus TaxID=5936 RepID=A0AAD1XZ86_EUPCR|nr:unnamed protein product [Moneuplotes crassus]
MEGQKKRLESDYDFEMRYGADKIIHRSNYGIIFNDLKSHHIKREKEIEENKKKGWRAPQDKTYEPLGRFSNVVHAFEKCKKSIPHTKPTKIDLLKAINMMKASKNPILKEKPPKRTLNIIKKNKKALDEIKQEIKRERQYYQTKNKNDQDQGDSSDEEVIQEKPRYVDNKKLNTPYFKLISNVKDGSTALKQEISKSVKRVKAARHGHSIGRIFQDHQNSYYLPLKESYISKKKARLMRLDSDSSAISGKSREKSRIFKTELPDTQYCSAPVTNSSRRRVNSSFQITKRDRDSSEDYLTRFREIKEKYVEEMKNVNTENNTISFIVRENNSISNENHKSINNILDYQPTRPSIEDEEVRMVSYINSKPIQPYISLLPLKNFLKKEQEFTRKGTLGQNTNDQSVSKKRSDKSSDNGQINWSKMLIEELSDLMKDKEDKLNEVRKKSLKTHAEESEMGDQLNPQKINTSGVNSVRRRGTGLNSFSSNRFVQNKIKEKFNKASPSVIGDMVNLSRGRRISTLNRSSFSMETNWANISQTDPRLNNIKKATRVEDLTQEDLDEVKKVFPQELMEVLEFNDYKKILFEHLEDPKFQKLLSERFKVHELAQQRRLKAKEADANRQENTIGKVVEEMTSKELEDLEESKKKEKMRLDQELFEFNKRGGFARVLHDLFYNPDPNSLEFDSVYKLKQLCMQYYEKKGRMGKELVETLDTLICDRPYNLSSKSKNFVIEDPNHPEGIKRKNFHYDIESMRINAEKDRIEQYKKVAETCARTYYVICKRLSLLNLEEVQHAQYILDYMKNVIESGKEFTKAYWIKVLDTLNSKELFNTEVLKVLKICFEELNFTQKDADEYLTHISNTKSLQSKYPAYAEIFTHLLQNPHQSTSKTRT